MGKFVKCLHCGKVKKYNKQRFPLKIYDKEGNFKGYNSHSCVFDRPVSYLHSEFGWIATLRIEAKEKKFRNKLLEEL